MEVIENINITTHCIDCQHSKIGGPFLSLICKCVGKVDVVTGVMEYKECSDARFLINDDDDWDGNCQWFKAKLTLWQKIKRLFKKGGITYD